MCGIAGIWNIDGRPIAPGALRAFTRALAHRGPDGEGIHIDGSFGLGHRRLSILDLRDVAGQPMPYGDGRYVIAFNGEIYNFLELRRELEQLGDRFLTESDTELIPAAYRRWGIDSQLRFNGMWAFALWDRRERTLVLARDRFGVKPLYVLERPGRLAFASEVKAFLHLDGFDAEENTEQIARWLSNRARNDETLIRGVKTVPPGHAMIVTEAGSRVVRWWRTLDHLETPPARPAARVERFRELFMDACRLRLRSDVPVGSSLSGGLDSSSVVCSLGMLGSGKRQSPDWQRAFIADQTGTRQGERHFADLAGQKAAARPVVLELSNAPTRAEWERFFLDSDGITGPDGFSAWALYREIGRSPVKVSIDGHGADEMLGGYVWHSARALAATGGFTRSPLRAIDLMRVLSAMHPPGGPYPPLGYAPLAAVADPWVRRLARTVPEYRSMLDRYASFYSDVPPTWDPWLREPTWDEGEPPAALDADAAQRLGTLGSLLYRDFHHGVLQPILQVFDIHSMAHSVEVRMPFLDYRLACYVFSLPDESKIGGGFTKRILRDAMLGIVPDAIRTRRDKLGYKSPLSDWVQQGLGDWLFEQLDDRAFLDSDLWDGRAIRDFARRVPRERWSYLDVDRLFLYASSHWCRTNWWRHHRTARLAA